MFGRLLAWFGIRRLPSPDAARRAADLEKQLVQERKDADALRVRAASRSFELEALKSANTRLEDALRFYADQRAWTEVRVPAGTTRAAMDGGKRARAALGRK